MDLYVVDDNSNKVKKINNSKFNRKALSVTLNASNRHEHDTNSGANYNTWQYKYFLPPKTYAVPKGVPFDDVNDNSLEGDLVVCLDVSATKNNGTTVRYLEDDPTFAVGNGSSFKGSILRTNLNPFNTQVNDGVVFVYNLNSSVLDDLIIEQKW